MLPTAQNCHLCVPMNEASVFFDPLQGFNKVLSKEGLILKLLSMYFHQSGLLNIFPGEQILFPSFKTLPMGSWDAKSYNMALINSGK